jgi:hypothetical protein
MTRLNSLLPFQIGTFDITTSYEGYTTIAAKANYYFRELPIKRISTRLICWRGSEEITLNLMSMVPYAVM